MTHICDMTCSVAGDVEDPEFQAQGFESGAIALAQSRGLAWQTLAAGADASAAPS